MKRARARLGSRSLVGVTALVSFLLSFGGCGSGEGDAAGAGGDASGSGATGPGDAGGGSSGGNSGRSGALGAFPFEPSSVTRGGTMTFTNVGAPGSWPRRLDRAPGDPACDDKDGSDTWGGHCCLSRYETESDRLAPFDEEMTLIFKAIRVKQLAIYQPADETSDAWNRVTAWDERGISENIWFTQQGAGSPRFPGDLTKNDCVGYVMQEPSFECGDGRDYYCPSDPGILHRGFSGSKLVVFLGSMDLEDSEVEPCSGAGAGHPGPWVAFVASELVRDGGRKWNGLCNCYSKTGTVGDGCGEINVFEVVMDENEFSNREFASTGVRSYQEGHVGGAVCKADCERDAVLPLDVDVVDACAKKAYEIGPEIEVGGETEGCPVWRRPRGDRYFFILLDEQTRTIQVGMLHPENLPPNMGVVPTFPVSAERSSIDSLLSLRLPG
ncbi:MAG: hypothetical protein B6A08_13635 [Sorangiineae bacterium NIC37A_2]|jgi:hypothetical protein|nr:MAG: hypothetical protein B6A08_13635 [Sorangiineae bacterium NIC37A_2]